MIPSDTNVLMESIMKKIFAAVVVLVASSSAAFAAAPDAVMAAVKACTMGCC
jgi:hypothetical protein